MVTLRREFYEFQFSTFKELRLVWATDTTNLKLGILRLSQWMYDFTPYTQHQTHVRVWIRLMELPVEYLMQYWMDLTLFEISCISIH